LPSELIPLRALAAAERLPHTVFLESGGPEGVDSEWTLLAFDPVWRLELRAGRLWRIDGPSGSTPGREVELPGAPLAALASAWPDRVAFDPLPSVPFASGLAGYIAYDFKDLVERYPQRARREINHPDFALGFYDVVWAWRRGTGEAFVVSTGLPEGDRSRRAERAHVVLDVFEHVQEHCHVDTCRWQRALGQIELQ
jgi:para-aminobenzoate synthetase component 1